MPTDHTLDVPTTMAQLRAVRAVSVAAHQLIAVMQEIAVEAYGHWDADRDAKVGKYLGALGGNTNRVDLNQARQALANAVEAAAAVGICPLDRHVTEDVSTVPASIDTATPALQVYEFINPSDAIAFDAPSDEVAALAALVVGRGQCSARRIDAPNHETVVGFAMFGGDGGFRECYGRDFGEALTLHAAAVMAACHSFRLTKGERTSLTKWCEAAHAVRLKTSSESEPEPAHD